MSLDKDNLEDLVRIGTAANNRMYELGKQDFSLIAIKCDGEEDYWIVSYYSDYGTEINNIIVESNTKNNGYIATGRLYE